MFAVLGTSAHSVTTRPVLSASHLPGALVVRDPPLSTAWKCIWGCVCVGFCGCMSWGRGHITTHPKEGLGPPSPQEGLWASGTPKQPVCGPPCSQGWGSFSNPFKGLVPRSVVRAPDPPSRSSRGAQLSPPPGAVGTFPLGCPMDGGPLLLGAKADSVTPLHHFEFGC